MRNVFYVTVLVCLLALATAPAVAQATSDQTMQKAGPTIEHKGPVAVPAETGFSGEAKAGASQGMDAHRQMKTKMKSDTMGQAGQPTPTQGPGGMQPANVSAQAKGGDATVARVDRSEKCLRVYSDPSAASKQIACMLKGENVHLTGMFSKDRRWAQLDNNGWALFRDLRTNVKPPRMAATEKSWGRSAAAGKAKPHARRHHYRGFRNCYPGYYYPGYYYYYPGYYGWY